MSKENEIIAELEELVAELVESVKLISAPRYASIQYVAQIKSVGKARADKALPLRNKARQMIGKPPVKE